ncbi:peptide chain release factor N(5)-glutamine methyltransferase [Loktanella sp. Alg231-35]|uniref:peptide chain release factor N(5)-glutamine methyltransferase n=1 Tax=Loktanella sp. Alg231-35 TaxID=1922220 RepID=UPI001F297800|nr:peptide chain release factor N(5)-glutamine methyltransferase [Loktanella sp. Alg231-35]
MQKAISDLVEYLKQEPNVEFGNVFVPNPAREARLLLAHAMKVAVDRLTLLAYDEIDEETFDQALCLARRRAFGEPTSHILGYREFFGRRFSVDETVLDPRPETEMLVQEALSAPFGKVLDLGTGSGAIIVTLLAERTKATGIAGDVSETALLVAAKNAATLGVTARLHLEVSDWYAAIGGKFDLIVSNPPYIAVNEMDGLQPEVRLYEPRVALTDEADGLSAYRKITAGAPEHLSAGGRLIVEIGPTQAQAVVTMMQNVGLTQIRVIPDLDGRDRVVVGQMPRIQAIPR